MLNYIFGALKVKLTVHRSIRNMITHHHTLKITSADDVVGKVGEKLGNMEGYVIDAGKYSTGFVIDSDKITELTYIAMLTHSGLNVRKVEFSFYKGVGDCYDGKPDGWVCVNI